MTLARVLDGLTLALLVLVAWELVRATRTRRERSQLVAEIAEQLERLRQCG